MSRFQFVYDGDQHEDSADSPFPSYTTIEATHEFDGDQTWQPILWQFCRFLEHIGFEGVRHRVKIEGHVEEALFQEFYERPVDTQMSLDEYLEALDRRDGDAT